MKNTYGSPPNTGYTWPVLATWFIRQLFLIFRRKFRQPILLFPPNWARFILWIRTGIIWMIIFGKILRPQAAKYKSISYPDHRSILFTLVCLILDLKRCASVQIRRTRITVMQSPKNCLRGDLPSRWLCLWQFILIGDPLTNALMRSFLIEVGRIFFGYPQ